MTEWILTSSALILIVLALRGLLKGKISLRLQYGLWALVLVRLLVPFSFTESIISISNVTQQLRQQPVVQQANTELESYESAYDRIMQEYENLGISVTPGQLREEAREELYTGTYADISAGYESQGITVPDTQIKLEAQQRVEAISYTALLSDALPYIWYAGMLLVGISLLICNLRFARKLRRTRRALDISDVPLKVYATDFAVTPCLFGLPTPAIYLTDEVLTDSRMRSHVLAHEMSHYRQGDHIWSLLRAVCLVLHWYNPLVWLAVHLSKQDAELACDEATIKALGESERTAYGRTLIGMTCVRRDPGNLLLTATTMLGSKKSLKERITLIAKKPRTAFVALAVCVLIAAIAVGCTFTGPSSQPSDPTEPVETTEPVVTTEPAGTTVTVDPTAPALADIFPAKHGWTKLAVENPAYALDSYVFIYRGDSSQDEKLGDHECKIDYFYIRESEDSPIIPIWDEPLVTLCETSGHYFLCTKSGKLVHFSMITGQTQVLYEAVYGQLTGVDYYYEDAPCVFFVDGDHVMRYDLLSGVTDEVLYMEGVSLMTAAPNHLLGVSNREGTYAYNMLTGEFSRELQSEQEHYDLIDYGAWPFPEIFYAFSEQELADAYAAVDAHIQMLNETAESKIDPQFYAYSPLATYREASDQDVDTMNMEAVMDVYERTMVVSFYFTFGDNQISWGSAVCQRNSTDEPWTVSEFSYGGGEFYWLDPAQFGNFSDYGDIVAAAFSDTSVTLFLRSPGSSTLEGVHLDGNYFVPLGRDLSDAELTQFGSQFSHNFNKGIEKPDGSLVLYYYAKEQAGYDRVWTHTYTMVLTLQPQWNGSYRVISDKRPEARINPDSPYVLLNQLDVVLPDDYTLEDLVQIRQEHVSSDTPSEQWATVPVIYPFSWDAIETQQVISDSILSHIYEDVGQGLDYYHNPETFLTIDSQAELNGDILTITVALTAHDGTVTYDNYVFDLTTGNRIETA